MQFLGLFVAAVVVEGIISYIKLFFVDGKVQWQNILALCLGVLVSISYRIDIFSIVGLASSIPYVGIVLTGILISRGSNYIYEVIKMIMNFSARITDTNDAQKDATASS